MFGRIAQLIILRKYNVKFGKVGERVLLGGTKRGSSGFASTGVIVIKKTKLLPESSRYGNIGQKWFRFYLSLSFEY